MGRMNLLSWDVVFCLFSYFVYSFFAHFCGGWFWTSLCLLIFVGIDDSETLKVHRSGGADPDGNQPGDLYVTIKVSMPYKLQKSYRHLYY